MKRVCSVYFSPSGGTKLVAGKVAFAMAEALGLPLEQFDISLPSGRTRALHFSEEDLVLIATPTYAGRIPNKLLPELEKLVFGSGNTPAVLLSVYGGRSNDEGLRELVLLAERNGFVSIAAAACVARHSMSRVLAAHRPDKKDFEELDSFARKAAAKALSDACEPIELDRGRPIAPYYRPFKEDMSPAVFLKAKPLTDMEKCVSCGLCASVCPMGSISTEDFAVVTGVCIKCHACVRKCPAGARYFDNEDLLSHIRVLEKLFDGTQDNLYIV